MSWGIVRAIILLPGVVLVFIPVAIVRLTARTGFAADVASPRQLSFWLGLAIGCLGIALSIWAATLFAKFGSGTPAPWDPPQRLVIRGPYRHVRNPLITGALLVLVGESLVFRSWPLAAWTVAFFLANTIYFPLVEEKALEERFGDAYRTYRKNVPRWIPRVRGWNEAG